MIGKLENMKQIRIPEFCGGTGSAVLTPPFERGTLTGNVVVVTLEPGNTVGEHEHTDDSDLYYVLDGEIIMIEDGQEYVCHRGDVEYCTPGHTHGAVNRSDKPASFLAVGLP